MGPPLQFGVKSGKDARDVPVKSVAALAKKQQLVPIFPAPI